MTTETERVRIVLKELPPSANKLWRKGMHGQIMLSSEGVAYHTRVQTEIGKQLVRTPPLDKNAPYRVEFHFELPTIFNKKFDKRLKDGRLASDASANRFNRQDVSNLRKLLEDVLAKVTCVDDSTTCADVNTKIWGPEPKVTIIITELPLSEVGWDAAGRDVPG